MMNFDIHQLWGLIIACCFLYAIVYAYDEMCVKPFLKNDKFRWRPFAWTLQFIICGGLLCVFGRVVGLV